MNSRSSNRTPDRRERRRGTFVLSLAAASAALVFSAAAGAQASPAAPDPAASAPDDTTRWSRCVTLGRSTTAVAQTQDWEGMEALARQQLEQCSWNAEMRLDAIENLADVAVMRGDVAGALDQTERCLTERAQRTGCPITRAFVLAQLQRPAEARGAMSSARAALAHEAGEYQQRRDALAASAAPASGAASPLGAAAIAAGSIPTGAPEELRAVQLQSIEDYRVKLAHYAGVIDEMSRAMGLPAR